MSMTMPESSAGHHARPPVQTAPIRAQILATEHWSLLATRSMTWSEVMSRIVIHLTVVSASLVVLALIVQADGFRGAFRVFSIGLAAIALLLGTLTGLRVFNASADDAAMLIGMNRLRSAYLDLDPDIEPYFVTSRYDDHAGVMASQLMGTRRSVVSHVLGSTGMFIHVVNALVAGTLAALIASALGATGWLIWTIAAVVGLVYLGTWIGMGSRRLGGFGHVSLFPSPPAVRGS